MEQFPHSSLLDLSSPSDTSCFGPMIIAYAQFSDKFYFVAWCSDGSGKTDCHTTPTSTSLKKIWQQIASVYPIHEKLNIFVFSRLLLTFFRSLSTKWTALPVLPRNTVAHTLLATCSLRHKEHLACPLSLFVRHTSTMYSAANGQHVNKNRFEFHVFWGVKGRNFIPSRRRDSSVGTVTRVGAVSIPGRVQGFFSVPQAPRPTVEHFHPPKIGTWAQALILPVTCMYAEVYYEWSCTSTLQRAFIGCTVTALQSQVMCWTRFVLRANTDSCARCRHWCLCQVLPLVVLFRATSNSCATCYH
jgi:hypothetical protein